VKTFKEFLELLEDDKPFLGNVTNMRIVGDTVNSVRKVATNAAIDYSGLGLAKNIFDAALGQRKNVVKKIQDDAAIMKAKEIIRSRISNKAQNRPGNIDKIISSYVSASEESEALLNDQERQLIIDSLVQAINNGSISSGFAQKMVNDILRHKITAIQNVLSSSKPKSIVI
jgi:hypothetical protein